MEKVRAFPAKVRAWWPEKYLRNNRAGYGRKYYI